MNLILKKAELEMWTKQNEKKIKLWLHRFFVLCTIVGVSLLWLSIVSSLFGVGR